jgi:virginiamycin B lyase
MHGCASWRSVNHLATSAAALAALVGCGGRSLSEGGASTSEPLADCGGNVDIMEVQLPRGDALAILPYNIIAGPDGNLWVTEVYANSIARLTVDWQRDSFPLPDARRVQGIASGPDGNVWFAAAVNQTDPNSAIGRITPDGQIAEFALPSTNRWPSTVTAGPDGNIWFADPSGDAIGSIGVDGVLRSNTFLTGTGDWRDQPSSLAVGADGNLWFDEISRFGRLTPAGAVTFYPLSNGAASVTNSALVLLSGPDGALWSNGPQIGPLRRVLLPDAEGAQPKVDNFFPQGYANTGVGFGALAVGPDGNIWYSHGFNVGCTTGTGLFHDIRIPSGGAAFAMALGPDGALWFTEPQSDQIGRISFR